MQCLRSSCAFACLCVHVYFFCQVFASSVVLTYCPCLRVVESRVYVCVWVCLCVCVCVCLFVCMCLCDCLWVGVCTRCLQSICLNIVVLNPCCGSGYFLVCFGSRPHGKLLISILISEVLTSSVCSDTRDYPRCTACCCSNQTAACLPLFHSRMSRF